MSEEKPYRHVDRIAELEEALKAVVNAWDADQFMRTGDVHTTDCGCLRCAMDDAKAILEQR